MLDRIFPSRVDNAFAGYRLAIWLLVAIVLAKLGMSYGALFDTRDMIETADAIPLETFGPAGAAAVVSITKLVGLNHLLLNVWAAIVLICWRAMVPFVYVILTVEQLGRKVVALTNPIARGTNVYLPVDPNLVLIAALLIGFALSLTKPRGRTKST